MALPLTDNARLGYADYVAIPADGRRHEIVDGVHRVNPAPSTYHQSVSRRIQFQLYSTIELSGRGEIFDAPTDLQLSPHDIMQPDLILVLTANRSIITPTKIKGIPDLVVEILSPGSERHDEEVKWKRYEQAGIPEYWIVDPQEHHVKQFQLRDAQYVLIGTHESRIEYLGLPGISVDLRAVW